MESHNKSFGKAKEKIFKLEDEYLEIFQIVKKKGRKKNWKQYSRFMGDGQQYSIQILGVPGGMDREMD